MFDRILPLLGEENFKKIQNSKILIVGIGGVGGIALEALVRSGFKYITIIDYDVFEVSNLNRQIISTYNSIGKNKVIVAKEKMESINKDVVINAINIFLDKNNIKDIGTYDYIIDTCDTVETKLELYKYAKEKDIKIISSMGMGNRVDLNKIEITSLNRTINDPLAKKIRYLCKKKNIETNIKVIASQELPIISTNIYSIFTVTNTAGIMIANHVLNEIKK